MTAAFRPLCPSVHKAASLPPRSARASSANVCKPQNEPIIREFCQRLGGRLADGCLTRRHGRQQLFHEARIVLNAKGRG